MNKKNRRKTAERNDNMAEALRQSVKYIPNVTKQIEEEKRLGVHESRKTKRLKNLF